jgi:hypothetical protein
MAVCEWDVEIDDAIWNARAPRGASGTTGIAARAARDGQPAP